MLFSSCVQDEVLLQLLLRAIVCRRLRHCCSRHHFLSRYSRNCSRRSRFTVAVNFQKFSFRNWNRTPQMIWDPHRVQEFGVPTPSFHSAFQRTATNHAIRRSDQVFIRFAVTSEPNTFQPCWIASAAQCSWSSACDCFSEK